MPSPAADAHSMASIAESTCRSEIDRARPECSNPPHPRNKEGAAVVRAQTSIPRRKGRTEETAASIHEMVMKMAIAILFLDRTAAPDAQPLMNGTARSARIKLDLAKRGFIVSYILLQQRHQGFSLLRTEINSLKVSQFHLCLGTLLHGPEDEKKIPDVYANLHAVRIGFAVVGGLHEFHIRLVRRIHTSKCNACRGESKVRGTGCCSTPAIDCLPPEYLQPLIQIDF